MLLENDQSHVELEPGQHPHREVICCFDETRGRLKLINKLKADDEILNL